ncbi:hypothetical protein D3C76_858700 [compost metagenome]
MGFLGGEYRVLVGQVHTSHLARGKLGADHLRFMAITHQDGDVRWQARAQFALGILETSRALLAAIEQGDDMAGATCCQLLPVNAAGDRLFAFQMPALQGCAGFTVDQQLLATAFGADLDERQRVVIGLAEQKCATPCLTRLGLQEHLVDRRDHGLAGAVVGVQAVQATTRGTAGGEVGVDVGATEGIDRLLGVADHEQAGFCAVFADLVDALENAVLHRVGVLELVDQRHRELFADQAGQALAGLAGQGVLQAQEHVVEAHFRTPTLLHFEACRYPVGGMLEQWGIRAVQGLELLLQALHGIEGRVLGWLALPGFGHARRGQAGKAGA